MLLPKILPVAQSAGAAFSASGSAFIWIGAQLGLRRSKPPNEHHWPDRYYEIAPMFRAVSSLSFSEPVRRANRRCGTDATGSRDERRPPALPRSLSAEHRRLESRMAASYDRGLCGTSTARQSRLGRLRRLDLSEDAACAEPAVVSPDVRPGYFDALFADSRFDYEALTLDGLGHDDVAWDHRALSCALG